ncbi:unnamed protein product [Microthlaspi erraticum]|uniref:Uncharacterized protein n=1 Tax=Microthlaspi erraticum TaxID=1685480 RepID=A0A6D2JXN5_9BRAS|nr:unnamed protein product [Microthlaspi erraticum]
MVEGESSNARERRLKMQADLEDDQRMEESDAEDMSTLRKSLRRREMALQVKKEVMRLRVKRKEKRPWIFEDVELVSRTCTWPSSSLTAWSLTRSSLVSFWLNEVPQYKSSIELIGPRLGMDHVLGKGEKRTFRQLEICLGSLWRREPWNSRRELQSPSSHAQGWEESEEIDLQGISCLSLTALSYKTAYNTRSKGKKLSVGGSSHQSSVQLESNWTREGLLQGGWTSSFARPTSSLSTRSWMGGSNSSSHIHWLDPPSFSCPTLSSPQV